LLNSTTVSSYTLSSVGRTSVGLNVGNIEKLKQEHKELFGEELSLN